MLMESNKLATIGVENIQQKIITFFQLVDRFFRIFKRWKNFDEMEFLSLQMRIRSHIRAKLSLMLRQDMQWLQDFRQYLRGLTRAAQAKQNKGTRLSELRFRRTLTIQFPIFEPEPEPQLERRMSSDINYCLPAEIQVTIHGLWLGYLDFLGVVHFLLHKKYSQIDSDEAKQVIQQAKQQLSSLDEATKVAMKTMWPNFKGPDDEKFHIHEFARHAFTPKTYKSKYFEEAISAAKPYIGGGKDLHKFLEGYVAGKVYEWETFSFKLQNHIGVPVPILCSKSGKDSDRVLEENGIIFSQDMELIPFPRTIFEEDYLTVRP